MTRTIGEILRDRWWIKRPQTRDSATRISVYLTNTAADAAQLQRTETLPHYQATSASSVS